MYVVMQLLAKLPPQLTILYRNDYFVESGARALLVVMLASGAAL